VREVHARASCQARGDGWKVRPHPDGADADEWGAIGRDKFPQPGGGTGFDFRETNISLRMLFLDFNRAMYFFSS
jgi:hypothetical protein